MDTVVREAFCRLRRALKDEARGAAMLNYQGDIGGDV